MRLASALIGVASLGEGRDITADCWPPRAALPDLAGGDVPPCIVTAFYPSVARGENIGYFMVADCPTLDTICRVKVEDVVQQPKIMVACCQLFLLITREVWRWHPISQVEVHVLQLVIGVIGYNRGGGNMEESGRSFGTSTPPSPNSSGER